MNRNITFLDELPYVDDLEGTLPINSSRVGSGNGLAISELNQINKFIRNNDYNMAPESGMGGNQSNNKTLSPSQVSGNNTIPQQVLAQQHQQQMMLSQMNQQASAPGSDHDMLPALPAILDYPQQQFHHQSQHSNHPQYIFVEPNCVMTAEHVLNCVVCSKLYNQDPTGYIIGIILLSIISILLLKRVLNV